MLVYDSVAGGHEVKSGFLILYLQLRLQRSDETTETNLVMQSAFVDGCLQVHIHAFFGCFTSGGDRVMSWGKVGGWRGSDG